jgi:hypothetical protein
MAIIRYTDEINRDTNIVGPDNVYFGNGQGCRTIYFTSVAEAHHFIQVFGKLSGFASKLCEKCGCHYGRGHYFWKRFPDHVCQDWKKEIREKARRQKLE